MALKNYALINSLEELQRYVDRLIAEGLPFGFDIETGYYGPPIKKGSLKVETNFIVGISFTNSLEWARYVPLAHDMAENLPVAEVLRIFRPLLLTGLGVPHNAAFELRNLARAYRENFPNDPEIQASRGYFPVRSDTQVEAYVKADYRELGLKPLTLAVFGHQMTHIDELFTHLAENKKEYIRFNELDLTQKVIDYACEDALWALALHLKYYPEVKDNFIYKLDMQIVYVVCAMEDYGIQFDWQFLRDALVRATEFREALNREIQEDLSALLGIEVNINLGSSKQLQDILYDKLGLKTTVMTKGGKSGIKKMSTNDRALEGLAKTNPVVARIQDWRGIQKLIASYLNTYEKNFGNAPDGRVHSSHNYAYVVTGRFSTAEPNYQQCLPGSYSALTPNGWVRLDEIDDSTPVAQYGKSGSLSFVVPDGVVRQKYTGGMVRISGGHAREWEYTPDHRIVYATRDRKSGGYFLRETTAADWHDELMSRPAKQYGNSFGRQLSRSFIRTGVVSGGVRLTAEERRSLAKAVLCQADGNLREDYAVSSYDILVQKDRKVQQLKDLGLEVREYTDGRYRTEVPVADVSRWLDNSKEKNFVVSEILSLCAEDLEFFVRTVFLWDGDFTRNATFTQHVSRRASVEVVQAAASLAGMATSIYERPQYDAVSVNICERRIRSSGVQSSELVPFDGMVYCVTVPTGMFLVRSESGVVMVTGNCPKTYHYDLRAAKEAHERGEEPPEGTCFKLNFRDALTVPKDYYFLGYDLSQAELRAIAGEAKEQSLLTAFERGDDVHRLTASLMLGKPEEEVTDKERGVYGKRPNFSLLYGQGEKAFGEMLGVSQEEGVRIYHKYFESYSAIAAYKDKQERYGRKHHFVWSKFGRKIPIENYKNAAGRHWILEAGDRNALNYPIQSSATGDFVRIGMVRATKKIKAAGLEDKIILVMNVHDSLDFYVHKSLSPKFVIDLLKDEVIFPVPGWPPMIADWRIGKRWGSPKDLILHPDGSIQVKGGPFLAEADPVPEEPEVEEVEEPSVLEETTEDIEQEIAPAYESESKKLIIELKEMPDTEQLAKFANLLKANPGDNVVELQTPEGNRELARTTSLTVRDQARISLALGGARVYHPVEDVDADEVFAGLTL